MFPKLIRGFEDYERLYEKLSFYDRPAIVDLKKQIASVGIDELKEVLLRIISGDDRSMRADIYTFVEQIDIWKTKASKYG